MTRNTKKNPTTTQAPTIELAGATYDDVMREYFKKFEVPPQGVAAVVIAGANPIETKRNTARFQ